MPKTLSFRASPHSTFTSNVLSTRLSSTLCFTSLVISLTSTTITTIIIGFLVLLLGHYSSFFFAVHPTITHPFPLLALNNCRSCTFFSRYVDIILIITFSNDDAINIHRTFNDTDRNTNFEMNPEPSLY